jgi:hypothetical protein
MNGDYDNSNTGALFKNDKQGNAKRPDYKGSLNVDGTEYRISAWLRTSKKGDKYMGLAIQPKEEAEMAARPNGTPPPPSQERQTDPFNDEVPF